jgi:hypothetical protein
VPKTETPKTTFGSGELSPAFTARSDTQQYRDGAKKIRNMRLLNSGALTRRPGSRLEATLEGEAVVFSFDFSPSQRYFLTFSDGRMDAYFVDGTSAGNVTGAPWTTAQLDELRFLHSGDVVFICHQDFMPRLVRRTGASSWSLSAFSFDTGPGAQIRQPYYKFGDGARTLQPGATTGTGVSLTASAALFESGHVGTRFRWGSGELEITGVSNSTSATCAIRRELPKTQELTVSSQQGSFFVGEVVEGDTSGAKGEIVGLSGSTVTVVLTQSLVPFLTGSTSDVLVGPNGSADVDSISTVSPAAWTNWQEQMFSAVRGYPQAVCLHKDRLCFAGHLSLGNAIITSAVGRFFDFRLGDQGDADPIFELLGNNDNTDIQHLVSAEDLIVLSRQAAYYVAPVTGQVFSPQNIAINLIDNVGSGAAHPGILDGQVMYADDTGRRVNTLRPTGDISSSWSAGNMSLLSDHLIRTPVQTAHAGYFRPSPERYSFFVNGDDGTMAVLHYIAAENVLGWTLWETDGEYRSVSEADGSVAAVVKRTIGGSTTWTLEVFDQDLTLDAAEQFANADDTLGFYTDQLVRVTAAAGQRDLGEHAVDGSGNISVDTAVSGPFEAGLFFAPTLTPLPPATTVSGISILTRIRRINKVGVTVLDSGRYGVDTDFTSSYRVGEDLSAPPPLRSETQRFSLLGRSREPTFEVTQDAAVPLTIAALSMEVTYHG